MRLRFAINPEFAFCLDEAQNILYAKAENEDATALLAQLELTGKPYAEAVAVIRRFQPGIHSLACFCI